MAKKVNTAGNFTKVTTNVPLTVDTYLRDRRENAGQTFGETIRRGCSILNFIEKQPAPGGSVMVRGADGKITELRVI